MINQIMADLDRKKDEVEPLKRQKEAKQARFNVKKNSERIRGLGTK